MKKLKKDIVIIVECYGGAFRPHRESTQEMLRHLSRTHSKLVGKPKRAALTP
jgi:hypothetical protein